MKTVLFILLMVSLCILFAGCEYENDTFFYNSHDNYNTHDDTIYLKSGRPVDLITF